MKIKKRSLYFAYILVPVLLLSCSPYGKEGIQQSPLVTQIPTQSPAIHSTQTTVDEMKKNDVFYFDETNNVSNWGTTELINVNDEEYSIVEGGYGDYFQRIRIQRVIQPLYLSLPFTCPIGTIVYLDEEKSPFLVVKSLRDIEGRQIFEYEERIDIGDLNIDYDNNAIRNISIKGRNLSFSYYNAEIKKHETISYTLGENEPEWKNAYYDWYSENLNKLEYCVAIDLNFDGIPELCNYGFGSAGSGSYDGISYVDGRVVEFDLMQPGNDWVSNFILVESDKTKEKSWLLYKESQSGVANQYRGLAFADFSAIDNPKIKELLYCSMAYSLDGKVNIVLRQNGGKTRKFEQEVESDSFVSEEEYVRQTIKTHWKGFKVLPHTESYNWYGYADLDYVSFISCISNYFHSEPIQLDEPASYTFKEMLF